MIDHLYGETNFIMKIYKKTVSLFQENLRRSNDSPLKILNVEFPKLWQLLKINIPKYGWHVIHNTHIVEYDFLDLKLHMHV